MLPLVDLSLYYYLNFFCCASMIVCLKCEVTNKVIVVWPTSWTPAVGGLFVCECVCVCVCESVCPRKCRHIARRMMNG